MKIVLISADGIKSEPFEHPGCRYFVRAIFDHRVSLSRKNTAPVNVPERRYELAEKLGEDTYAYREVYNDDTELLREVVRQRDALMAERDTLRSALEAQKRPGVMIQASNADEVMQCSNCGCRGTIRSFANNAGYCSCGTLNNWKIQYSNIPPGHCAVTGVTYDTTPTERTCSVCSKTCDLGKCWWCGNE